MLRGERPGCAKLHPNALFGWDVFFGVLGEHWEFQEPVFLDLNPKRGKDGFDRGAS